MRTNKSISLDIEIWSKIEEYMKKNNQENDVSNAVEEIIIKFFESESKKK